MQSTLDSISKIKEEAHETSSSDDDFRNSQGVIVSDDEQDVEEETDNYEEVFGCKDRVMSYNSPSKSPFASTPYTATPSPYGIAGGSYATTPIPKCIYETSIDL